MNIVESIRELQSDEELVIGRFYTRCLNRDPRINDLFRGVDLQRQSVMLTTALNTIELNYVGSSTVARTHLLMLGEQHQSLGVPKDVYPVFEDCLIETLAEYHGSDWDIELQQQWREALHRAFETLFEAYD